jgi:PAS domain S-box-containing protein
MENQKFFYRILLPSLVAVILFLVAIYLFVIPGYRENLMDKKRETIRELTNTAWSILHKLDITVSDTFTLEKAQQEALLIISDMKYGEEFKDYFWITDTFPRMVMHPYRPQMNGMDLRDYTDSEGKKFFVEIVEIVRESGDGYIDYKWQWKDDSVMVVPKLSYVKLYEPWGWIVGTGIYVDDVKSEIGNITRQVVWISFVITLVIAALISYLARRNYSAEAQRQKAQDQLRETMEKYKKLVEASTDGVLMTMDSEIVYCNPYLLNLLGYTEQEAEEKDKKFLDSLNCLLQMKVKPDEAGRSEISEIVREHKIRKKNNLFVDVIITRSEFDIQGKSGFIYTIKDVSKHRDVERELDLSMEKFKSIADAMNLGIFRCTLGRRSRFIELNKKFMEIMGYRVENEIKSLMVQELFSNPTERKEITRAINEGSFIKDRLLRLNRADGSIVPVLVSLFPVKDAYEKVVYCDGIVIDAYEHLSRDPGFEPKPAEQHLSANVLLKPVKEFMIIPPVCELNTPVEVASRLMTMRNSDIMLVQGEKKEVVGLLTHGDISRRLLARKIQPSVPVSEIMSAPVITVTDQEMIMDAFNLMIENKISYIVVKPSDKGCPGYISLLALSELKKDTPEYLIGNIRKAGSVEEISELMKQLPNLVSRLIESGTAAATTGKLISRISDSITEKIIQKAIQKLGEPPVPFVFLALGSDGRREQTLATDQDNVMIYLTSDKENPDDLKKYFLDLGNQVCSQLHAAGYPYCEGGVMAMNPEWCLELDEIKAKVASWINTPNPRELLNVGIFFDFRPVYGDTSIATSLQKYCLTEFRDKHVFFYNLVQNITGMKPSLNMMGQLSFETKDNRDYLDIKKPIMILTAIIRMWSLKFGISERNTLERLLALQTAGVLPESTIEEFGQAIRYMMLLRIRNQLRDISENQQPGNIIPALQLSDLDRTMLRKILSAIAAHQNRLATEFRIT